MEASLSTKFYFQSAGLDGDTFRVAAFRGEEEISRLFRFEIDLLSQDPEVDLQAVLDNPAHLGMERDGEIRKIHGMVSEFEQRERGPEHVRYRAVLVPRLWKLSLRRQNQVHQEMAVGDIIEHELKEAGFTGQDYEISLQESHPEREYVVQYQESDLSFILRLMENEGIFFYFTHEDDRDKVVIADKNAKFIPIEGEAEVIYRPPSGMDRAEQESVLGLVCRQKRLPKEVMLRDYNWRTPSLDMTVKATVHDTGEGLICEYGSHYKDKDGDGAFLARVRAEEILCGRTVFSGESNVVRFSAGLKYSLAEHYRGGFNQEYILTRVVHTGTQLSAGAQEADELATKRVYQNGFTCIAADVVYRPERRTPRPRILGTVNAKVDAGGDGAYAELDDQGRYKVAIPFDQKVADISDMSGGKGSRWIRKAEPYSGAGFGFHFPLHKGAEVLLTHIDGDPDRPIIAAAVPNPETGSPVAGSNQTQCVINTGGGNNLTIEDSDGGQRITLSSPTGDTVFSIGAPPK